MVAGVALRLSGDSLFTGICSITSYHPLTEQAYALIVSVSLPAARHRYKQWLPSPPADRKTDYLPGTESYVHDMFANTILTGQFVRQPIASHI